jgi:hypothetical protein
VCVCVFYWGFELGASSLLGRCSTTWAMPLLHITLLVFYNFNEFYYSIFIHANNVLWSYSTIISLSFCHFPLCCPLRQSLFMSFF